MEFVLVEDVTILVIMIKLVYLKFFSDWIDKVFTEKDYALFISVKHLSKIIKSNNWECLVLKCDNMESSEVIYNWTWLQI